MEQLGVERMQAEGGAGLLLSLAQESLTREEFILVADSIPAISDIIGKAPRVEIAECSRWRAALSRLVGGLGGLACVSPGFQKLGMDDAWVPRFAETMSRYFAHRGGPVVDSLLRSVWR